MYHHQTPIFNPFLSTVFKNNRRGIFSNRLYDNLKHGKWSSAGIGGLQPILLVDVVRYYNPPFGAFLKNEFELATKVSVSNSPLQIIMAV